MEKAWHFHACNDYVWSLVSWLARQMQIRRTHTRTGAVLGNEIIITTATLLLYPGHLQVLVLGNEIIIKKATLLDILA